jgi:uncharacterized repeat protein (TIGR02543 family)
MIKNLFKVFVLITFAAIIGFSFTACDNGDVRDKNDRDKNDSDGNPFIGTWAGDGLTLTCTRSTWNAVMPDGKSLSGTCSYSLNYDTVNFIITGGDKFGTANISENTMILNTGNMVYRLTKNGSNNNGGGNNNNIIGTGTKSDPFQLTDGFWVNGTITSNITERWYSFNVTGGTTYRIWWNDGYSGDTSKTADVKVTATYQDTEAIIFDSVDSAWDAAQSFTPVRNATILIKVYPYNDSTGTFAIAYCTEIYKPAISSTAVTVAFDANGATGGTAAPSKTVSQGSMVTLPGKDALVRTGYAFGGWNTSSAGSGTNYDIGAVFTVNANTTLYARWIDMGGGGTQTDPILLTNSFWANGNINVNTPELWYSFTVTSGTTYRVWWNDSYSGDTSKTADVKVTATYQDTEANIFGSVDSAWDTAQSFTPVRNATILIKVYPYNDSTGTFAIVYGVEIYRPAISSIAVTITFDANGATSGTTAPSRTVSQGSAVTLPVQGTLARTGYLFGGWNTSPTGSGTNYNIGTAFTVNDTATIYARWIDMGGAGTQTDPIPLISGVWTDGNINVNNTELWYSFNVTGGTTYRVWWNDSDSGDTSKTLDVRVTASYQDTDASIFSEDSAWNTARSFTPNRNATVLIKVTPYYGGGIGTFAIAYSTGSTRP